MHLRMR